MAKTVSLNEYTYSAVAAMSGKLTAMAKKPISLGMAIHMAVIMFDEQLSIEKVNKFFMEKILPEVGKPEDFDKYWDEMYKILTKE